jgi:hypothetical protein
MPLICCFESALADFEIFGPAMFDCGVLAFDGVEGEDVDGVDIREGRDSIRGQRNK